MKKTKMIKDWFAELPEEVREKAIRNTLNGNKDNLYRIEYSLLAALIVSFSWNDTPEGYEYWKNVWKNQRKKR